MVGRPQGLAHTGVGVSLIVKKKKEKKKKSEAKLQICIQTLTNQLGKKKNVFMV